jgi:UDP-GlcNAc:undecaprenyl-phosphate/decaprenyl-phosphate GlcNAc-1-phosphate transferase
VFSLRTLYYFAAIDELTMNTGFLPVALALGSAFIFSTAATPLAGRLGRKIGITAEPATQAHGTAPIPACGGAAIILAIMAALAITHALPLWIIGGAGGLFLVGAIDDAIAFRPGQKLVAEIVIIGWALAFALPALHLTPWPMLDFALVGFWLVATTNAYNLIDGLDGLAGGVGVVIALALALVGALHGNMQLTVASVAVAGAIGGFLVYNYPPASIIMGDGGALPIGFLLGALALWGGELADNSHLVRFIFPVLVMLVPLLDTAVVSATRLATGNSISRRGLDHSHHRLLAMGLGDRDVVGVSCAVAAVGAACAVAADLLPHDYVVAALPFLVLSASVIALFMMDVTFDATPPGEAYETTQGLARFLLAVGYKRRAAEAAVDVALISAAYYGAFLLRLDFHLQPGVSHAIIGSLPWVLLVTYPAFFVAGIYRGIWRYTGLSDAIRFANGSLLAGVLLALAAIVLPIAASGSIVALYIILLFNLLAATRFSFQALRRGISVLAGSGERALVIGAGEVGAAAASFLSSDRRNALRLVGFLDDDGFKHGKLVHGQRVLGTLDDLDEIWETQPFEQMVVASDLSEQQRARVTAFALSRGVAVRRFSMRLGGLNPPGSPLARQGGRRSPQPRSA